MIWNSAKTNFDCRFSEIPCYDGILGDLNGDNKVNAGDYQELSKAFGKCVGDIGFNSEADYDEDDCVSYRDYRIWFFLLGVAPWGNSTVSQAIDDALKNGGDALINVSVTSSLYGFVPIYNIFCYTCTNVEGVAIEFESQ